MCKEWEKVYLPQRMCEGSWVICRLNALSLSQFIVQEIQFCAAQYSQTTIGKENILYSFWSERKFSKDRASLLLSRKRTQFWAQEYQHRFIIHHCYIWAETCVCVLSCHHLRQDCLETMQRAKKQWLLTGFEKPLHWESTGCAWGRGSCFCHDNYDSDLLTCT